MLNLVGVTKIYSSSKVNVVALNTVDLKVNRGEFVGIMGPSGSGKSTILNIIGCIDSTTSGTYLIENKDISKIKLGEKAKIRNKHFGLVFQSFNLVGDKTVYENVRLPLKYSTVPKRLHREMVEKALLATGMTELRDRYPGELSGGQQQRAAISRALVNDPEVILADEPTGNLDTRTGTEIMEVFKKLHVENKKTIILITHDAKVAAYSERVLRMVDGRIVNDDKLFNNEITFNNPFSKMDEEEGA